MKVLPNIILSFCLLLAAVSDTAAQVNPFTEFMLFDVKYGEQSRDGNIFYVKKENGINYLGISDAAGFPIYYKKVSNDEFHFQPHGSGELSYYNKNIHAFILLNEQLEVIDTVEMTGGYKADSHELYIDDEGSRWMMAYDRKSVDMSELTEEGSPDATVTGLVIQCVDRNGGLLFEWQGWDHFTITDTYVDVSTMSIDYIHANSIQRDTDSTFILSSRNLSEISKINMKTGEFVWRLGGKNNQFTFSGDPKNGFSAQHTAYFQSFGLLTVFDNGVYDHSTESRGLMVQLNEEEKTATMIAEFKHDPSLMANIQGNFSVLPNANSWIYWGSSRMPATGVVSEYDQNHTLIYDAWLKPIVYSYRIYKDEWQPEVLQASAEDLSFYIVDTASVVKREIIVYNRSSSPIVVNVAYPPFSAFVLEDALPFTIPAKGSYLVHISFKPHSIGEFAGDMFLAQRTDTLLHSVKFSLNGIADFVSVESNGFKDDISVYPNPFSEHFRISGLPESEEYYYRIIDVYGRVLSAGLLEDRAIELGGLAVGMYFLELSWGDGTALKRVQKVDPSTE